MPFAACDDHPLLDWPQVTSDSTVQSKAAIAMSPTIPAIARLYLVHSAFGIEGIDREGHGEGPSCLLRALGGDPLLQV